MLKQMIGFINRVDNLIFQPQQIRVNESLYGRQINPSTQMLQLNIREAQS